MVPHNEKTNRIYLFETCLTPILNDVSLDHDYNASGGSYTIKECSLKPCRVRIHMIHSSYALLHNLSNKSKP